MKDYINGDNVLPLRVEKSLQGFIESKFEDEELREAFPNPLLREDVLNILDRFCTVVYYPLRQETDNNGFRLMGVPVAGELNQNFVFINTAQTLEKQVFTAAHELGHIWEVDSFIISQEGLEDTQENRERIINRFAAVILMPQELFLKYLSNLLHQEAPTGKTTTIIDLLRIIVQLMSHFFAPYKAVVRRLIELGLAPKDIANVLLSDDPSVRTAMEKVLAILLSEYGLVQFQKPTEKRWIEGLADLLDIAEKTEAVPDVKIKRMRQKFGLELKILSEEMKQEFELFSKESDNG